MKTKAYDFSLYDQDGVLRKLSDYKGRWVVIYFYPKDNTVGCTIEACGFRDLIKVGLPGQIQVLGISRDKIDKHKMFADAHSLNFPILSDVEGEVIKAYGADDTKSFLGFNHEGVRRNTYLVDPEGNIVRQYENVNPLTHPKAILIDLKHILEEEQKNR